MLRKDRIEYLIIWICIFVTSAFIYGILVYVPEIDGGSQFPSSIAVVGCLGGILISGLFSSIILAIKFFKRRKMVFKIVSAILWPITMICVIYVGVFANIPYQIYNIVKIIKEKSEDKTIEEV